MIDKQLQKSRGRPQGACRFFRGPIMSQPLFDVMQQVGDRIAQAPHRLLCVSYDGTLTHFAATPEGASLSPQMDRVLQSLTGHEGLTLAIFSGRDRNDLQSRINLAGVIYVGNHGLEISGPGQLFVEPGAAARTEALEALAARLTTQLEATEGVTVDFKGLTISVHYRQLASDRWEDVRRIVHAALAGASYPFVLTTGEKVYEIRPRVDWNKGSAVTWILEQLSQQGKPDTLPIYVGDDPTDEDAFAALPKGITVKARGAGETAAHYTLEGPAEVRKLLEWIEELVRHDENAHPTSMATAHA
jgi:trehalose 6-phosphate phosphatase